MTGPASPEHPDGDRLLGGERSNHTLQPTALLHEAWLRLSHVEATWQDQGHFVRAAAGVMRRVLGEHARARGRDRRGGAMRITLAPELLGVETAPEDLLAMDDALVDLDPQVGSIVEPGVFGGLSHREVARLLPPRALARASSVTRQAPQHPGPRTCATEAAHTGGFTLT